MTEASINQIKSRSFELVDASTRTTAFEQARTVYQSIPGICLATASTEPPKVIRQHLQLNGFLQASGTNEGVTTSHVDLLHLIDELRLDSDSIRRLYGNDLCRSLLALQLGPPSTLHVQVTHQAPSGDLSRTLQHASAHYRRLWESQLQHVQRLYASSLRPNLQAVLATTGLIARHTLSDFMRALLTASHSRENQEYSPVASLARLFILYQQLERMRKLAAGNRSGDLVKEYDNWRPDSHESLEDVLLQVPHTVPT
jgi:hypothetical protein